MRLQGTLSTWNDTRGFGYIESTQGGEPIFVHISAWPRGPERPQEGQAVSFEIEMGPKGKRACRVQALQPSREAKGESDRAALVARGGAASMFAVPAFLLLLLALVFVFGLPAWVPAWYLGASVWMFIVYAFDKAAALRGDWRTQESTLHVLALVGGWPGALIAQQLLRHKSAKQPFRQMFWITVFLNVAALVLLASPVGRGWWGWL